MENEWIKIKRDESGNATEECLNDIFNNLPVVVCCFIGKIDLNCIIIWLENTLICNTIEMTLKQMSTINIILKLKNLIMENKINIAEILKNCEKGMELDCTMYEDVTFLRVDNDRHTIFPIKVLRSGGCEIQFTKYGQYAYKDDAKCVIFPKGKTTWEGFHKPFKDGDIVVTKTSHNFIFYSIYKGVENRNVLTYVDYHFDSNRLMFNDNLSSLCFIDDIVEQRFATEDEKQELFDAIKANGYKWNAETKTLENLVEPKFKIGDRVRNKNYKDYIYDIHDITDKGYRAKEINADSPIIILFGSQEDNYELVPNKFDITTLVPFESKVLVRDNNLQKWSPAMWGYYDFDSQDYPYKLVGGCARYCIPYEKNEHLLGTTNDCDEFYKNW